MKGEARKRKKNCDGEKAKKMRNGNRYDRVRRVEKE